MSSTSQPSRRQIMQPWPLCLASFGKPKERAILPKQYSRVPSIARTACSSNRQLVQDCSSNSTLLTQVSPFASQLVIEQQQQQQQQHYYADNLRNNRPKAFDGSVVYNSDHYSKQLDPLLAKDVPASDTKILMESQDLKKPAAQAGSIPQFQKEPRRRRPYYLSQVLAAFSVSIGSMVVGFASSYTSPALVTMKDNSTTPFLVDEATSSWIGSIMPLSALIGGIVGGPLIENVGRRNTILSLSVPFFLSWLLIGLAYNVGMVLGGRSLSGFCVGVLTLAMPVYLGETIQPEVRGTLGLLPTAFGNIGILLCFTVGMFLNWWQLALAGALIPIPFGVLMFMIPETPRWYIAKGQAKRARASLQWLRGRQADVSDELASVERLHVESERQAANHSAFGELFKGRNLKPLAISLGLMFFQQMSGINAVIFYTVNIFMESGSDINENISTIIVGVVNFASTFLATAVIDHLGRKVLLYISSLSMIASLATLGVFFHLKNGQHDVQSLGWLPLASFVVYVLGFSLGFGPVPWLMMGEILPAKIRGSAASIVTGFNWSCTFVVTKMFTDLTLIIGWAGTFWLFGFICVCGFVFVLLCVPETSGRSLEEIERGLTGGAARATSVRRMSAVANIKPTPMGC